MSDKSSELNTARKVYAGASRRAARAWALVQALAAKELLIPVDEGLERLANAIYHDAKYDAYERYSSIDEFKVELKDDLLKAFGEPRVVSGKPHYVVRPFFAKDTDFLLPIGLGYVQGYCALEELSGMNVKPLAASDTPVTGLSDEELDVLIAHYRRSTLTLVNAMRLCVTALHYVRKGVANQYNSAPGYAAAVKDADIPQLLAELEATVTLPIEPAPPTGFSSDKTHILRVLPPAGVELFLNEP